MWDLATMMWFYLTCHYCSGCCRARDTQNRSGLADEESIHTSCKLPSQNTFTGVPDILPTFPLFSEVTTYHFLERDLGLLLFCISEIRGKAIFLKICLKGNELIISNLKTVMMNLLPLDLFEVPEVMSNWKMRYDNLV